MGYRKSLRKTWWREISRKEFMEFAKRFEKIFAAGCRSSLIEWKIEIYESVAELDWVERNEKAMKTLRELEDIPERVGHLPYIRLTVRPKGAPLGALGRVIMSAMLSPGRIVFYAQPAEVDRVMERELFPGDKAPRGFKFGSGFEL